MRKKEIFENERAFGYNQFVETWIPGYHYFLDNLPKILREVSPKKLLVVGCGTGNEIERFVKWDKTWQITGVDPSADMIAQAKTLLQGIANVEIIEGVAADLDSSKKYSAATLLLVLHFLEDNGEKLRLLKDIAEILEQGAAFVMLDITGDALQIEANLDILKKMLPDNLEEEQVAERLKRIANELFPVSEERICELCVEAGFEKPLRFFQSGIYMGWLAKKK